MSEEFNICISCGLCCNGTFIGFVQLDNSELTEIRQVMEIEEVDNNAFFLQPCNKLTRDGCSIYTQRPIECGKFKCSFLKSFEKKELSFDLAIEIIDAVKQKRFNIENLLETLQIELQSKSFYFKMVELKKLLPIDKADQSLDKNQLELISELKELDKLLSKYFGVSF